MVQRKTLSSGNDNFQAKKTEGRWAFIGFPTEFDRWDIDGGDGSDTLIGGDKRDTLRGGVGLDADRLEGRQGDDRYFVDRSDDVVIERSGEGRDMVNSTSVFYRLPNHVELLDLFDSNHSIATGVGNSMDNGLFGTDFNNVDRLFGEAGNDTLVGFGKSDELYGGTGFDSLEGGEGDDILQGADSNSSPLSERDTLIGGNGSDTFVLGVAGNRFYDRGFISDFAHIEDFRVGQDTLQLAGKRSDYVVGNNSNLLFDKDGSGDSTTSDDLVGSFGGTGMSSFIVRNILDFDTKFV